MVGFLFSAVFMFSIFTSGLIVMPWIKTVKYITAIVVVTNIGWSFTISGSIRSTNAKATAPRKPREKCMFETYNVCTMRCLWGSTTFRRVPLKWMVRSLTQRRVQNCLHFYLKYILPTTFIRHLYVTYTI